MIENKKIMVVATTDDMIWRFVLPHMQRLQKLGNTVECVCAKTGFWFDELKDKYGFKVWEIDFTRSPFSFKNLRGYKKLKKLQKQEKYDLIYCQQPVGGLMGRLIAKKFKLPCIYTAHGFHFFKGNNPIKNLIFKTIEKYLSKFTTALVTINDEDYEAAKKMKAKRVYKINGIGVDLNKYKPDINLNKLQFKKELGLNENDFVVVSVGELNENKNTYRIIEAVKNIHNNEIKYLICGDGPLKEKFEICIRDNNLNDRVQMLGYRKDVPNILNISDLYIMPSYREGLSRAMMEAMCYGLPVVASKIRGNTDLLGDQEGGLLCDPTNTDGFTSAILEFYNDNKMYDMCSKRNKEFVKNFDISIVLKQLENIYDELDV